MRFVAASKTRVYATDDTGRLLVLNAASGARLDAMPIEGISTVLANSDTDRIYLVSEGGLIQCLREAEQTEPLMHNKERKDAAKAGLMPPPSRRRKPPKKSRRRKHAAPATPKESRRRARRRNAKPKLRARASRRGRRQDGGNPDEPAGGQGKKGKQEERQQSVLVLIPGTILEHTKIAVLGTLRLRCKPTCCFQEAA